MNGIFARHATNPWRSLVITNRSIHKDINDRQYPCCWNRQLDTSNYCNWVRQQQVRADKKWTEEQMSALQQIIKTGEAQNLSKEDIQAQLDAKKQEFKGVKTSTTPKSPGVDTENFSGSELDDYFSDSVTEKNAAEPWGRELPGSDMGPGPNPYFLVVTL